MERLSRISLILLGVIGFFATLYALSGIFAPLALALVTGVVLSPVSDFWERTGLSSAVGALASLVLALVVAAGLVLVFQPVIAQLVEQAPKVWSDLQETITLVRGLQRGVADLTGEVSNAIAPEASAALTPDAGTSVALPSVTDAVMAAPAILSQMLVFAGALFFFLLTRKEIYDWAALNLSGRGEQAQTALKLLSAERHVSRYFLTITMINAGLGAACALVFQAIGLPGAVLWGVMGFLVNFVVYLGPAVFVVALLFAGVAAFDGGLALLPAAIFVLLNGIEGQFVTPALVGRNLSVNPLLVFLSLIFGIWLWGAIGGIVAIPLLLWVLVLNDRLAEPAVAPTVLTETE